jgi:O-antigen/teichoic acid export membrane protein
LQQLKQSHDPSEGSPVALELTTLSTLTLDERETEEPGPEPVLEPAHQHKSVGQSVARGALAMLTTQPLTWGVSLLAAAVTPGLLGADILGQVTIAVTICNIASTIACIGVSEYLVRRVAQRPEVCQQNAGVALAVQMLTSIPAFALVALLGVRFANGLVEPPLLLVALLPILLNPMRTVLLSLLRGLERHSEYAWLNAVSMAVSSLAALVLLALGSGVVLALLGELAFVAAITAVYWVRSGLRPAWPAPSRATWPVFVEAMHGGLPFMGWQLTQMLYSQVDRLLLGVLAPAVQVGWYAAANRIVAFPIFIPTLIITPLFPALSRSSHAPHVLRRTLTQTIRVTLLLTVPLSAGIVAVAPAIPPFLGWPADFANATTPMAILALQLPLVALGMVLGSVLMAMGRERRLVLVAVVATVFNIAANVVAIPLLDRWTGNGGIGAALVTVASEVIMVTGALLLTPKYVLDPRSVVDAGRIVAAGIATGVVASALLPVALLLSIGAGAATYVGVVLLVRVVGVNDLDLLSATPLGGIVRRLVPERWLPTP